MTKNFWVQDRVNADGTRQAGVGVVTDCNWQKTFCTEVRTHNSRVGVTVSTTAADDREWW